MSKFAHRMCPASSRLFSLPEKGSISVDVKDRIGHHVSNEDPTSAFELLNLLGKGFLNRCLTNLILS